MLKDRALEIAVTALPTFPLQGDTFRVIKNQYANTALSTKGALKYGGRYNPPLVFGALYIADTPGNALLEVKALVNTAKGLVGVKSNPLLILSLEYQLNSVLDIVDLTNQTSLDTNLQELIADWRSINIQGQIAPTQQLGMVAYSLGSIEALKVPSAYVPDAYNLVVFPDRLFRTSFVRVYDNSGSINAQIP